MRIVLAVLALSVVPVGHSVAGDYTDAHASFVSAFNERQWEDVKGMFSDDAVFHRATGDTAHAGPDAIVERFSSTIGAADGWNVKFAKLDTTSSITGKDGRVVERGDFAVTAGGDSSSCYAGSFMMTWVPGDSGDWSLQALGWQDIEADMSSCE